MREWIDLMGMAPVLNEDGVRQRRTRTKTRMDDPLVSAMPAPDMPLATIEPISRVPTAPAMPSLPSPGGFVSNADARAIIGNAAGRIRDRMAAVGGLNLPMDAQDEIDDAEARRRAGMEPPNTLPAARPRTRGYEEPAMIAGPTGTALSVPGQETETRTPENLPALVRQELTQMGEDALSPKWMQIKQLPGYMLNAIRVVGRQVFATYTHDFPMEQIQTINTILHGERDVRRMFEIIAQNGELLDEDTMDFSNIMPGLVAEIKHFAWNGYHWLLMHDMGGFYVYGWPGDAPIRLQPGAATPPAPRRLR